MIPRRRFPNGKLEALTRFRRHRYCGPKCAGAARIGDPKRRLFASLKVDAPDKCWTLGLGQKIAMATDSSGLTIGIGKRIVSPIRSWLVRHRMMRP
jgi:hypothetical protein